METNEAFPARETNPADFDKLEGYNPKRPKVDAPKRPGQITRGQTNEAWALYKSNPSRMSWGELSRDRYIASTKLAFPAESTFARGQLFT